MKHIVALSGGKDSTALALRLQEAEPQEYTFICTPTGDELPEMVEHWTKLETLLGAPLLRITNETLEYWITKFQALPNWRQRWCTRLLKIEPTKAYLAANLPATLYVGLRADEPMREGGIYEGADQRFPLREWGWGLSEVTEYLRERGVIIPRRTDCARCYGQRLIEWKRLWRDAFDIYADAARQEEKYGATFRSPGRDTWPASLAGLAEEFKRGRKVRGEKDDTDFDVCRACSL